MPSLPMSWKSAPSSSRFSERVSRPSPSPTRSDRSVIHRACEDVYSSFASSAFASASTVSRNVVSRLWKLPAFVSASFAWCATPARRRICRSVNSPSSGAATAMQPSRPPSSVSGAIANGLPTPTSFAPLIASRCSSVTTNGSSRRRTFRRLVVEVHAREAFAVELRVAVGRADADLSAGRLLEPHRCARRAERSGGPLDERSTTSSMPSAVESWRLNSSSAVARSASRRAAS